MGFRTFGLCYGVLLSLSMIGQGAMAGSVIPGITTTVKPAVLNGLKICPMAGWGTSCKVSGLKLKRGHHYTFPNLAEVKGGSPEADIGWGPDPSRTYNLFYHYARDPLATWFEADVSPDYSFADHWYMGTGELANVTCPKFAWQNIPDYKPVLPYIHGTMTPSGQPAWNASNSPDVVLNGVYCMVNNDNTQVVKAKVTAITSTTITVDLQHDHMTGLKTYGCRDGYCNEQVKDYCVGCKSTDAPFLAEDFKIRTAVKSCVDDFLKPPVTRPMVRIIYPNTGRVFASGGTNAGSSGEVYGFEGAIQPGQSRVTRLQDVRVDLHEMFHQYTATLLHRKMPRWLNEGLSIEITGRLKCHAKQDQYYQYGSPTYEDVRDGRRSIAEVDRLSGHLLGTMFFDGLKKDYGCADDSCFIGLWHGLQNYYQGGTEGKPSVWGIRSSIGQGTGIQTLPLVKLLKITDQDP